jgi:hypothetical protein
MIVSDIIHHRRGNIEIGNDFGSFLPDPGGIKNGSVGVGTYGIVDVVLILFNPPVIQFCFGVLCLKRSLNVFRKIIALRIGKKTSEYQCDGQQCFHSRMVFIFTILNIK